jgi:hypothetical protein
LRPQFRVSRRSVDGQVLILYVQLEILRDREQCVLVRDLNTMLERRPRNGTIESAGVQVEQSGTVGNRSRD